MSTKGSVRIIPVDFTDNKLEKRALFLKHKARPAPRKEFKEFVSNYLIGLAVADLADAVKLLEEEDRANVAAQSDRQLDKFAEADIEAYLARKRAQSNATDDDADVG